jgi:hypothetical protein
LTFIRVHLNDIKNDIKTPDAPPADGECTFSTGGVALFRVKDGCLSDDVTGRREEIDG